MLLVPISVLAGATVLFTVALVVVYKEQQAGERLFLSRFRGWVDRRIEAFARLWWKTVGVVGISIMYVVHHLRAGLARAIAPRPRRRKQPKERLQFEKTDNHLSEMHDHKSDTALTEAQKKKLRNKKLEERF